MIHTSSARATIRLGERIAVRLKPNDVVALTGELGAGKTTLIQGIARGIGIKNYVTSPTFTIVNEFKGRIPLYHMDLYRLGPSDISELGLDECFARGGVTVIEWAEKIRQGLPADAIMIDIRRKSENKREFTIKGLELK